MWDHFVNALMHIGMPLVLVYHILTVNVFLNVSADDAIGAEKIGNTLLVPVQYLFAGKMATLTEESSYEFRQKFNYTDYFWCKSVASLFALPTSLFLGTSVKSLSLFTTSGRMRHERLSQDAKRRLYHSNGSLYETMGIELNPSKEKAATLKIKRRPGDENVLKADKEALRVIGKALNQHNIPWWVDCGTCLGAYQYEGVIPWDWDIDIAVLLPDFENVQYALQTLDENKYSIQDWSSRDYPNSYLKVYIKESGRFIDIYHFAIDPKKQELIYLLSLEKNIFFPKWWKIREERFTKPVAIQTVFPLKRGEFDGVEVFLPNDTKAYLQRCYGEDLMPAKRYDPNTCQYEKDLTHPYWQRAYVH